MSETGWDSGPGPQAGSEGCSFQTSRWISIVKSSLGSQFRPRVCLVPNIPVSPASSGWSHENYGLCFAQKGSSWPHLEQVKVGVGGGFRKGRFREPDWSMAGLSSWSQLLYKITGSQLSPALEPYAP